jgi:two-component system sensor histidine kinase/response regulator
MLLEGNDALTAVQRSDAKNIRASSDLMMAILDDVLDMSKLESGKITFGLIPFSLPALLASQCRVYEQRAYAKGLNWSQTIDPSLPHVVIGDPTRFNQIISNLLHNALKFTAKVSHRPILVIVIDD